MTPIFVAIALIISVIFLLVLGVRWADATDGHGGDPFERGLLFVIMLAVLCVAWAVFFVQVTTDHHHRDPREDSSLSSWQAQAELDRRIMALRSVPCPVSNGVPGEYLTTPGAVTGDGCYYTSDARRRDEIEKAIRYNQDQLANDRDRIAKAQIDYATEEANVRAEIARLQAEEATLGR